jgi:hypothetical protein
VLTVHHLSKKKSMRLITYEDEFQELRREIKNKLPVWISKLDPSDLRTCGDNLEVAQTRQDDM